MAPTRPFATAPSRWIFALAALAAIAWGTAACDILSSDINPEEIRVVLEGTSGDQVRLIVADRFSFAGGDEVSGASVSLLTADTTLVALPYDRSFPLAPSFQFYALAVPADSAAAPIDLSMRILVDGAQRFSKGGSLGSADFEYVYTFSN